MGDESKTLELLIRTKADLAAALNAEAVLKRQILNAKLLGQEYSKQEEQLTTVRQHIKSYTDATGESTEQVEHLEVSHHALHHIMEQIGMQTAPQLGEALSGALYGPVGGVIALGAIFEWLEKKMAAVQERAEKLAALKWDTSVQALDQLTQSVDDLDDALTKAGKSADPIKDKYAAALAVLEAQVAAHKAILEAMEKEELAAAGTNEALKDSIKARYETTKSRYDEDADQKKLALKAQEIAQRKTDQPTLEEVAKDKARGLAFAQNDSDLIKAKGALDLTDSEKGKLHAARATIDFEGGKDAVRNMPYPTATESELGEDSETARYSEAQAALKLVDTYDANAAIVAQHTETIRRLEKIQKDAADKAEANLKGITDAGTELDKDRKTTFEKEGGTEISKAIDLSRKAKSGVQLNPAEELYLRGVGTMIAGQNVSTKQAETMFQIAANNQKALDGFLDRLMNALNKVPNFAAYEARLRTLENKFDHLDSRTTNGYLK